MVKSLLVHLLNHQSSMDNLQSFSVILSKAKNLLHQSFILSAFLRRCLTTTTQLLNTLTSTLFLNRKSSIDNLQLHCFYQLNHGLRHGRFLLCAHFDEDKGLSRARSHTRWIFSLKIYLSHA